MRKRKRRRRKKRKRPEKTHKHTTHKTREMRGLVLARLRLAGPVVGTGRGAQQRQVQWLLRQGRQVHVCAAALRDIDVSAFAEWIGKTKAVSASATVNPQHKSARHPSLRRGDPKAGSAPTVTQQQQGQQQRSPAAQPLAPASTTRGLFGPAELGVVGNKPVVTASTSDQSISKRKQFRSIYVPPSILNALDALEIGWRRGRRRPALVKQDDWQHVREETPVWRRKLAFLGAAKLPQSFIPAHDGVKEVCFIGRSNVGKSSVINALGRSNPARTEDKPGVTKTVNFYALEKSSVNVVDLPGYGFAFAKTDNQNEWQQTVEDYLSQRANLRRIFVLLDARHGLKRIDIDFLHRLQATTAVPFQLVLTKCDLVPMDDIGRRLILLQQTLVELPGAIKDVITVSATSGAGMRVLRREVMAATSLRSGRVTGAKTASSTKDSSSSRGSGGDNHRRQDAAHAGKPMGSPTITSATAMRTEGEAFTTYFRSGNGGGGGGGKRAKQPRSPSGLLQQAQQAARRAQGKRGASRPGRR
ncbi:hypothetical protein PTSG_02146 [Salpingoeca rosetta]|uniref:EngB-type G domain-containing protein n=1 Tax=Salpingoeca rosetta (strain ATCC 50818 / BSB-021) TaxID=946362 RepID=F2U1C3_SALR5|nr:uncharacterized protein PTSG_02146 [Salpingoeca rosetta]EGD81425.1 hypothetical protein PTSG_02146 [Salpingoeca rosetta]|eukprot:XP_004996629.1 hypothetical protein PTSG_02146 [Salpingoeca rosetta]